MSIMYLLTSLTHCLFDIEGSNKSHCMIKLKIPIGSVVLGPVAVAGCPPAMNTFASSQ